MALWLNWIEQPPPKGQVAGSNPAWVTKFTKCQKYAQNGMYKHIQKTVHDLLSIRHVILLELGDDNGTIDQNHEDLRGGGRIILLLRKGTSQKYNVCLKVPYATGCKFASAKTLDWNESVLTAMNLYNKLYHHVKLGGSIKFNIFKDVFNEWKKSRSNAYQKQIPNIGLLNMWRPMHSIILARHAWTKYQQSNSTPIGIGKRSVLNGKSSHMTY